MINTPEANKRLLESAGLAWDELRDAWVQPKTGRVLNGTISRSMTPGQVTDWLNADGAGKLK